eukprot:TRINITY_DN13356_c1_g3_i1.p1 TRINITY_DN13356_c1_g3~~TRINITY_DN13356_c1_g3_i1.p1  ORF type:complete len:360 (-),score=77.78 TRINITY_DN13356_c1_g3_i1:140-1192(-)
MAQLLRPLDALSPPLSPTSSSVFKQAQHQIPLAIVHRPAFRQRERSNSQSALPSIERPSSQAFFGDADSAYRKQESRPVDRVVTRRITSSSSSSGIVLGPEVEVRELSREELRKRSKEAVDHFKQAANINRRARTIEDINLTLATVRKKRAEALLNKDGVPNREARASPPGREPAEPEPQELDTESALAESAPKKLSLAEQMGYGVKVKEESKWSKLKGSVEVSSALRTVRRRGTFADIKAGDNDLKARLAAKRAEVEAEMKGFESMDLSIPDFINTFRNNPNLVNKVSMATGIAAVELKSLNDADLAKWFTEMDTDNSGTLDFDEFVEGIVKMCSMVTNRKDLRRRTTV